MPTAELRDAVDQGAALLGVEPLGGVAERLGEPLARGFRERELLAAQPLDRRAVDSAGGEQVERLRAVRLQLLAHWQQVVYRALGDGDELGLLVRRGVGFDREMLDRKSVV